VIERWKMRLSDSVLVARCWPDRNLSRAEREVLDLLVEESRTRISGINWFMRCLNEY
jgi:hypothetical protein